MTATPTLERRLDQPDAPATSPGFWPDAAVVALGALITLCVSGYQFGRGNHTVYLLDGLRLADPTLLARDWFVTSTLQYHTIFSRMTAELTKLNLLEPVFLAAYVALIGFWHVAWLRWTRLLGGSTLTYLFSVVLYYVAAGGIGLGAYQFMQDGSFLPSNVASIAMLWGFYLWCANRPAWAGFALGAAGLFHLNYGCVALATWAWLMVLRAWDQRSVRSWFRAEVIAGSILLVGPTGFNLANALSTKLHATGTIPLEQFVKIYVHFRHAHHFDPFAWPAALWIAFLLPLPVAAWVWTKHVRASFGEQHAALRETARIVLLIALILSFTFVFAGVFFVSESLVQMMNWRFSVYIKLLSCIGVSYAACQMTAPVVRRTLLIVVPSLLAVVAALLMAIDADVQSHSMVVATRALAEHRQAIWLFVGLAFLPAAMSFARRPPRTAAAFVGTIVACVLVAVIGWNRLGWGMTPEKADADYLKLCSWAREATPVDSIFLVPPQDTVFRLEAQRAIVVNFKHVPQLSGEIVEWMTRIEGVLGTQQIDEYPRDYVRINRLLNDQYEARSPEELIEVATRYDARYVVVDHPFGGTYKPVYKNRRYFVYDRTDLR